MTVVYLPYGSNLHPDRMRSRVPRARALGTARMPGLVARLARDGLVERCRLSHDRRAHLVRLTLNGRKALAAVEKPYFRAVDHTLAGISAADRQKAIRVLVDICRSLDTGKGGRK